MHSKYTPTVKRSAACLTCKMTMHRALHLFMQSHSQRPQRHQSICGHRQHCSETQYEIKRNDSTELKLSRAAVLSIYALNRKDCWCQFSLNIAAGNKLVKESTEEKNRFKCKTIKESLVKKNENRDRNRQKSVPSPRPRS